MLVDVRKAGTCTWNEVVSHHTGKYLPNTRHSTKTGVTCVHVCVNHDDRVLFCVETFSFLLG